MLDNTLSLPYHAQNRLNGMCADTKLSFANNGPGNSHFRLIAASLLWLHLSAWVAWALVPGDAVFVADINTGAINKFSSTGQGSAFGSVGAANPVGLALDAAGNLYVANRSGGVTGTIDRFDLAGHRTQFSSQMDFPSGMAFDRNGQLYAGMVGNNTVQRFDSSGHTTVFASSGLHGPLALAFDPSGNLYVSNQDDSTIMKFDSAGQPTFFAYSGLYPDGLTFDRSGNLYVANFGDNTVQKIDPAGNSSTFASGLNAPVDLAFDEAGNLFVLDLGDNSIVKFDPAGNRSLFANTAMNHPESLAIFIVPEPTVPALLALGASATLLCRRRGRDKHNQPS